MDIKDFHIVAAKDGSALTMFPKHPELSGFIVQGDSVNDCLRKMGILYQDHIERYGSIYMKVNIYTKLIQNK